MPVDFSTDNDPARERVQDALATSDARLRALLEAAVDGIISIDERGLIQTINPAAERLFGYTAQEVIGQNIKLLMPSPYREEHDGYLARYLATGEKRIIGIGREVVGLRKDGTTFPMDLSVAEARVGCERIFVGIIRDITERKRTEERFRLVVESTPNAIVMVNAEGLIVLANAQAEKFFGYRREELVGQPVEVLVPERFRVRHSGYRESFFAFPTARPMGAGRDLYGRHKDGSEFPVEIGLTPIQTSEGLHVLSAIVDISERKRAEESLRESEERFRLLVEGVRDHAIFMIDPQGRVASWNTGAERLMGYTAAEILGRVFSCFHTPDDIANGVPERELRQAAAAGQVQGETWRVRKDGSRFWADLVLTALHDEHGRLRGFVRVTRDVTERKRAEEALRKSHEELERLVAELRTKNDESRSATQQLWHAAKLASVGELAASIAHELNNPLATVSLRVESLLAHTPEGDARRRALEIVEQETKRMGNLVANLLQFSRRGVEQVSTVDVRQELTQAVELIHHLLRKRQIAVVQELAPDTPTIFADRQKLRQVFLNLVTNASDAMPQGGTLTLRAAPATLDNGQPAVLLEFSDTGVGIPAEHLGKIMEPFFTTKEEGKGTGLGLAICRRVVEEHHGAIQIISEVGKGTTVRLVLPLKNGTNVDSLQGAGLVK
jgi:PAS domain S-box-containing protein